MGTTSPPAGQPATPEQKQKQKEEVDEKKDTPTETSEVKTEKQSKKKSPTNLPVEFSELEATAIAFPKFRDLNRTRREEDQRRCEELTKGCTMQGGCVAWCARMGGN